LNSADIALLPVVEEWVETYQSTANDETSERAAMYELISCIIRCCGVSGDVEEDETLDVDGVADAVERIQDESLQVS
jgi:cohesin complex subunit SA-1/2